MDILRILFSSLLSVLILFIITRLTGRRQVSELTVFDYINGITIGSIAANAAVSPLNEFFQHLIAMAVFGGCSLLLSIISDYSLTLRHLFSGKPMILYQNGVFHKKAMSHLHLDLSELLMLCRNAGYFDLSQVQSILMEVNGKLSILPVTSEKPATPAELNTKVKQEELRVCVILDGELQGEALSALGFDLAWLQKELKKQKITLSEVFLGMLTASGKLSIYPTTETPPKERIE